MKFCIIFPLKKTRGGSSRLHGGIVKTATGPPVSQILRAIGAGLGKAVCRTAFQPNHEDANVSRRNAGNARGLAESGGADFVQFLSRLGPQTVNSVVIKG